jgi:hypothetical protein
MCGFPTKNALKRDKLQVFQSANKNILKFFGTRKHLEILEA